MLGCNLRFFLTAVSETLKQLSQESLEEIISLFLCNAVNVVFSSYILEVCTFSLFKLNEMQIKMHADIVNGIETCLHHL